MIADVINLVKLPYGVKGLNFNIYIYRRVLHCLHLAYCCTQCIRPTLYACVVYFVTNWSLRFHIHQITVNDMMVNWSTTFFFFILQKHMCICVYVYDLYIKCTVYIDMLMKSGLLNRFYCMYIIYC